MKLLISLSMLMSFSVSAQSLDLAGLKNLFTASKAVLEKDYVGQTVLEVTKETFAESECTLTTSSKKTIVRVEADSLIVHTQTKTEASSESACVDYMPEEAESAPMLSYEDKVTLQSLLTSFDEMAKDIKAISKNGTLVTLSLGEGVTKETMVLDSAKSGFAYTVLSQVEGYQVSTSAQSDVNVKSLDLSDILFCEWDNEGQPVCSQGDYSDVI